MRRRSYQLEGTGLPKYKYSFNDKTFDLSLSTSLDSKIGATRAKPPPPIAFEDRIKSSSSFTLDKLISKPKLEPELVKTHIKTIKKEVKLPSLHKRDIDNPEQRNASSLSAKHSAYYMGRVAKGLQEDDNNYLIALAKQHFAQTIEALKIGKELKMPNPTREIKLPKKNPKFKTVCLDLDETLIHCDEMSNNFTVKLDFPIEGGGSISVVLNLCRQESEYGLVARTFSKRSVPSQKSSFSLLVPLPTQT